MHIAYAISVCKFILNPKNKKIQISELPIKHKILKYLNKLVNKERISNSDEEQEKGEDKEGQEEGQEEGDQEGDQEEDQEEDQGGNKEGQEEGREEKMNEGEYTSNKE